MYLQNKQINNDMQESLITLETAEITKEKGFNEVCRHAFQPTNNGYYPVTFSIKSDLTKEYSNYYLRPTQSLLQRWLREVHKIHIEMSVGGDNQYGVIYGTWNNPKWFRDEEDIDVLFFQTYEEALEAGLYKSLLLIKN